jgi:hypothetical protein
VVVLVQKTKVLKQLLSIFSQDKNQIVLLHLAGQRDAAEKTSKFELGTITRRTQEAAR